MIARLNLAAAYAADFFLGFGLAFGAGGGSGLPSTEEKRPEVKV